ncbi:reticulon-4-interacting protein 1 homolog, mitochondrial-like isoform X2 [Corticium candelabrum]|uniref:reticulon-4-interacting protein 1 homolog, mitochondrial-like isoform X2 n=1 Tax=Corticium candelabrum TaxID=121492 RepID=UPI002E275FA7|nr:reticulon-4-interacting protein 1 homolog, mitochondrial-like isoform X2 [Corticium candelabrum]
MMLVTRLFRGRKLLQAVQPARQIESLPQTMNAIEVERYTSDFSGVQHNPSRTLPALLGPKDVMVKIHSSSVNPIDLAISRSYGRVLLNQMRKSKGFPSDDKELPLVLGRDCSGVVVATGHDANKFEIGTEVWATPAAYRQGCHAEFTVMGEGEIALKPKNITHTEAAAVPYVAMTSWKALVDHAGLNSNTTAGKRILITGGSGGIGSFAIQLMKAWDGHVTTTCSSNAVQLLEDLGADKILDYSRDDLQETLQKEPKFDVVYDTVGNDMTQSYINLLKEKQGATYVTLRTPLLSTVDANGLCRGLLIGMAKWANPALSQYLAHGRHYRWAFFAPNGDALKTISKLVEDGKIKPIIQETFPLAEGKAAYEKLAKGHARGKIVIEVIESNKKSDDAVYTVTS